MSEWWTYRPSDFLMFAPRAYWRLSELANVAGWPLQLVTIGAGLGWCLWLLRTARHGADSRAVARAGAAGLAACWAAVAWLFLHERYAAINWAAGPFAMAFALQALALAAQAGLGGLYIVPRGRRRTTGLVLAAWALFGQPLLGLVLGRPWRQMELFGVAPDPTLIATLAFLTLVEGRSPSARIAWRCLWLVPLLACAGNSATLATMGEPQAAVLPLALAVALWAQQQDGRRAA